jgi:hypothetical protein
MDQLEQKPREAPSSLAPVQVERASDDQDLAGMRGRRGPRIVIAVAVLAAGSFGGFRLLRSMDAHQVYARSISQLERSDIEQREAFVRCALPNQQSSQLAAPSAMQSAIEIATARMGNTYAKVLTKCTPLLENFQHSVASIEAPADTASSVRSVSTAANAFAAAWLGLRDFLQSPGEHDRAQVAPHIQAITTAWSAYQTARSKAKEALSARL